MGRWSSAAMAVGNGARRCVPGDARTPPPVAATLPGAPDHPIRMTTRPAGGPMVARCWFRWPRRGFRRRSGSRWPAACSGSSCSGCSPTRAGRTTTRTPIRTAAAGDGGARAGRRPPGRSRGRTSSASSPPTSRAAAHRPRPSGRAPAQATSACRTPLEMGAAPDDAAGRDGWAGLFRSAFVASRNAMALLDDHRRLVDCNGAYLRLVGRSSDELIGRPVHRVLAGGPVLSDGEWAVALAARRISGEAEIVDGDGVRTGGQWAASIETVTGRRRVLLVVLSTSRWGPRFRREPAADPAPGALTPREREVVGLIAGGDTAREIADELHIAHDTVRTHARNAMAKLGARSRAHLVAIALGEGHALD